MTAIGDSVGGGKVAWIGKLWPATTESVLLIAAAADTSTSLDWAVDAYKTTACSGADSWQMGGGVQNTLDIVAQNGAGNDFAAGICNNLSEGGYDDWFCPSMAELFQLYVNQAAIGGFSASYYWSSTERTASYGDYIYFPDGTFQNSYYKSTNMRVRACRWHALPPAVVCTPRSRIYAQGVSVG
jgi:hypothetical protein